LCSAVFDCTPSEPFEFHTRHRLGTPSELRAAGQGSCLPVVATFRHWPSTHPEMPTCGEPHRRNQRTHEQLMDISFIMREPAKLNSLRDELREMIWLALIVGGLSLLGVGLAVALALTIERLPAVATL